MINQGHLPQPTLILHGTEDHLVPLQEVQHFQEKWRSRTENWRRIQPSITFEGRRTTNPYKRFRWP